MNLSKVSCTIEELRYFGLKLYLSRQVTVILPIQPRSPAFSISSKVSWNNIICVLIILYFVNVF